MHQGTIETSQRAVIPSLTKEEFKGTAYGVYNMAVGAVALPTNIAAGFIYASLGSQYAFLYGSILALFASLAMAATQMTLKRKMEK
jgi:MFS family permease